MPRARGRHCAPCPGCGASRRAAHARVGRPTRSRGPPRARRRADKCAGHWECRCKCRSRRGKALQAPPPLRPTLQARTGVPGPPVDPPARHLRLAQHSTLCLWQADRQRGARVVRRAACSGCRQRAVALTHGVSKTRRAYMARQGGGAVDWERDAVGPVRWVGVRWRSRGSNRQGGWSASRQRAGEAAAAGGVCGPPPGIFWGVWGFVLGPKLVRGA